MDRGDSALEIWRQKLRYLQEQEAIASEPAQKFQLKIQIQEAKQKIAELESQKTSRPEKVKGRRKPEDHQKLEWRWFILGCVLLFFAVTLVIWGFSLRVLTEDQRRLLVWALPLASGFSVGAFAGSIYTKSRNWISEISITASGGFAVWFINLLFSISRKQSNKRRASQSYANSQ